MCSTLSEVVLLPPLLQFFLFSIWLLHSCTIQHVYTEVQMVLICQKLSFGRKIKVTCACLVILAFKTTVNNTHERVHGDEKRKLSYVVDKHVLLRSCLYCVESENISPRFMFNINYTEMIFTQNVYLHFILDKNCLYGKLFAIKLKCYVQFRVN
jgi:hypothetical protein